VYANTEFGTNTWCK